MIRTLISSGFKVVVITEFDGYEKKISNEVSDLYPLYISRKGINPLSDIVTFIDLLKKITIIKADYLFLFTIKPVIYGSIVARIMRLPNIVTITGLGTSFISESWITKIVKLLYKFALQKASVIFFQNQDDKNLFEENNLVISKVCKLVPGSGIDLKKFEFSKPRDEANMTFLLIARMIKDKGIVEFVDAARYIKKLYPKTNFHLLGPLDVINRTAISRSEINQWVEEGTVEYLGDTDNVKEFIRDSSCIVLPSYMECTSKVLLEAASIGRPIVTSNVAGCKEIVDDGINGFLCKSQDSIDLGKKIHQMLLLPYETRVKMGILGRKKMESEFNQKIVLDNYKQALLNLI